MTGKRITGTMRGLGALEVSENIKGAFIADDGLLLEDVGKLEKRKVVVYLVDDDPAAKDSPAEAATGSAGATKPTLDDLFEELRATLDKANVIRAQIYDAVHKISVVEITHEPPTMGLPFSVQEAEGEDEA